MYGFTKYLRVDFSLFILNRRNNDSESSFENNDKTIVSYWVKCSILMLLYSYVIVLHTSRTRYYVQHTTACVVIIFFDDDVPT